MRQSQPTFLYSETSERFEYEDDEYHYYVKAVPKLSVSTPEKTVKRINGHRETEIIDAAEVRKRSRKQGSSLWEESTLEYKGMSLKRAALLGAAGLGFAVFFSSYTPETPLPPPPEPETRWISWLTLLAILAFGRYRREEII